MATRSGRRWLATAVSALTVAALAVWAGMTARGQAAAQEPLLWGRNVAGDSRAVQINADDAVTWVDQGKRIMVLKGKVWVEQGDASFRASQAVILIDEAAQKQNGVYHMDVYSDGGVSLEVKAQSYEAAIGMIELNTRGVVNLKTFKSKVAQQPTPDDPLYKRAVDALARQKAAPKPKEPLACFKREIQPVVNQVVVAAFGPNDAPVDTEQLPASPAQPNPAAPFDSVQPAPVFESPGQPGSPSPKLQPPLLPVEGPGTRFSIMPRTSEGFKTADFPMADGEKATVISPGVIISIGVPAVAHTLPANKLLDEKGPMPSTLQGVPQDKQDKNGKLLNPKLPPPKDIRPLDPTLKTIEIAADRVVVWSRGGIGELAGGGLQVPAQGQPPRTFEFYLAGNVEIFDEVIEKIGLNTPPVRKPRVLRASEVYYRFTTPSPENPEGETHALALSVDLEERQPGVPDAIHVATPQLNQPTAKFSIAPSSRISSSKLPYDPGFYVTTCEATLEQKRIERKSIFNLPFVNRDSGEPEFTDELLFHGKNVVVWLEGIPVFWLPYIQGDARDPLGPLQSINIGFNKVFGFQLSTTWNVYNLLGMDPVPGTRWRVGFDYYTERGFLMSTEFSAIGKNLFGVSGNYFALVKAMGIDDHGPDILGGNRGEFVTFGYPPPSTTLPITHPELRGRFFGLLNWQDMPYGLTVQTQLAAISDHNFLDQYYNAEWTNGPNQETFLYVKQQENNWALSALVEPRIRNWVTETEWLPRFDGYWLGQDFLDTFTFTSKASAGYAHLETTHIQPLAFEPTDVSTGTGRFDWWNELALPLQLGAFKIVPYGLVDLTYYTDDLNGNGDFRFLGGGGVRGSIPFSRLYPDVSSELLNLDGIFHKIVLSGNYYWVHSDRSHYNFPQLDRLNDDETDQTLRDIRPQQPTLNPANATMLNSGFFDPQLFALRKLVTSYYSDTLDSIEAVELDLRQRWQTKRGYPGNEHIIDWITLDLSATFFPQSSRDNFGESVNFLQYDFSWAVGDRVSVFSSGWFDPHPGAARVWNFGTEFNRPDTSSLYLGYRQIDPLQSKQVIASVNVPFSVKYSVGASTSFDFGTNTQINSLTITRKGTDLMVSLGFSYNSIISSFGFTFEVYPNLLPGTKQIPNAGNLTGMR